MTEPEDKNNRKSDGQEAVPTAAYRRAALGPGAQIGPYKLIGVLGEGGYGIWPSGRALSGVAWR